MSKTKVLYQPSILNKPDGRNLNGSVQAQNVKSGRVYVFGKDSSNTLCVEDDEDDIIFEMVKARPRKGKNGAHNQQKTPDETKKVKIIIRPVFPSDTLSKFALQYGCTVAELKQSNSLYSDQDFHALKNIKIPIQPHSLLTEKAEEEKRRENAFHEHDGTTMSRHSSHGDNSDSDYENLDEIKPSSRQNIRTVSISAELKAPERFLKEMDNDIQKICQSVSTQKPDANDINRRLTTHCIHPRTKKSADELGSIWTGFGWKGAVIAFVVIAIILPLLYFIYVEKIKS